LAKHILQAAPNSAKVIFENEVVRVIEITMKKGQKVPMHQHRKGLGYSLNSGKIRSTREDGRSEVVNVKRGEVSWEERAYSHAVDNLGATLTELSFEFKSQ
jgi:quercetin dioxygenase-like cupin family protein